MLEVHHEDPAARSFLLFVQTADAVLKYADTVFYRHARLSIVKLMVLQILEANGGTMGPSKIAEQTLREAHGITTLVRRMQKNDLVVVKRNEKDHRYVDIRLTDKGRAVIKQVMPTARQIINQIMLSIQSQDSIQLEKLLKVMRENAYAGIEMLRRDS